jgi:hypothetical protein
MIGPPSLWPVFYGFDNGALSSVRLLGSADYSLCWSFLDLISNDDDAPSKRASSRLVKLPLLHSKVETMLSHQGSMDWWSTTMSKRLRCFLNGGLGKESNRMKLNQDGVCVCWYHRPNQAALWIIECHRQGDYYHFFRSTTSSVPGTFVAQVAFILSLEFPLKMLLLHSVDAHVIHLPLSASSRSSPWAAPLAFRLNEERILLESWFVRMHASFADPTQIWFLSNENGCFHV